MKGQQWKYILCALLSLSLCVGNLASCSQNDSKESDTESSTTAESLETETEEMDPFADFDYNGQSFRIYTSTNDASDSLKSSNFLIKGPEEMTGEAVSDAAYERNAYVEELLNVDLNFTDSNLSYDKVQDDVRSYIMAGADDYELIINDLYGLTSLTLEGMFYSADAGEYFDLTKPYWYGNFMKDIAFRQGDTFMMAGDFIVDTLRTAHCLIYNKDLYENLYGDRNALYDIVLSGGWTLDKMTELVDGAYIDTNGNGQKDIGDTIGFSAC